MKTFFLNILSYLRASFWFIPLLLAIAAAFLAIFTISIDQWLGHHWATQISWLIVNQPVGARAILATIAGSMITVAGVTFSMTLVAVSFALGQIGPRLIHNFMRDRISQFTLGTFIASFLYCLLVLRTVLSPNEAAHETAFVPQIAIYIAIFLAMVSIVILILFIHHVTESMNVYNILAKIGNDLSAQINNLFPEKISEGEKNTTPGENKLPANFYQKANPVFPKRIGYIRFMDVEALQKIAIEKNCTIEIKHYPGEFVTKTTPLFYINCKLDKKTIQNCLENFAIGNDRDQYQDLLFLFDEIAEIIARALSPGVNDPFTAMNAISWLQSAIEELSRRKIPNPSQYDKDNNLRVKVPFLTLNQTVEKVFGQIQPYVSHDRNTIFYLMNVIQSMLQNSSNPLFQKLLLAQANNFYQVAHTNLVSTEDKNKLLANLTKINNFDAVH